MIYLPPLVSIFLFRIGSNILSTVSPIPWIKRIFPVRMDITRSRARSFPGLQIIRFFVEDSYFSRNFVACFYGSMSNGQLKIKFNKKKKKLKNRLEFFIIIILSIDKLS